MTQKHTPGPWVVVYSPRAKGQYPSGIKSLNARNDVAGVVGQSILRGASFSYPSSAEGQANAYLIAAAPDLLTGCVEADGALSALGIPEDAEPRATIREAIAKARRQQ